MDSSVRFWDRNAGRYARRVVADPAAYEKKLAITRQYLHREMTVLEFGCGTGSTALCRAPCVSRYLATDISPAMIRIAREKLSRQPVAGLTFQVASLDTLHAPPNSFDAVLGLNILHLLADPAAAVAQVFTMLKPGGVFVSNTVCMQDTRPYLKPLAVVARLLGLAPFVAFLSRQQLENSLRQAGFEIAYRWVPETTPDVYFLVARKP